MDQIVGIDVSKARLDAYCLERQRRLAVGNDAAGIEQLVAWLTPGSLVVMEASGGYERLAHRLLTARGIKAAGVNPPRGCATSPRPAACSPRPIGSTPR